MADHPTRHGSGPCRTLDSVTAGELVTRTVALVVGQQGRGTFAEAEGHGSEGLSACIMSSIIPHCALCTCRRL